MRSKISEFLATSSSSPEDRNWTPHRSVSDPEPPFSAGYLPTYGLKTIQNHPKLSKIIVSLTIQAESS